MTIKRLEWAVNILQPAPDDHILEIGCGAGLLAEMIVMKLRTGELTAIDSSASMISKAIKRNQSAIKNHKLRLYATPLSDFSSLPYFNKIVAFNVNIFWKPAEAELANIRKLLKPGGQLFVFYQTPSGIDATLMNKIKDTLISNGFLIQQKKIEEKEPVRSFVLIAIPV